MTKAKARQRAKAKAAEKAMKRKAQADAPPKDIPAGRFDPGSGSIKSARDANVRRFGGARRGASRSR